MYKSDINDVSPIEQTSNTKLNTLEVHFEDTTRILNCLNNIRTFPKTERLNTRTLSDIRRYGPRKEQFCVGILHSYRDGPRVGAKTNDKKLMVCQKICTQIAKKYAPKFAFTSIQINKNFNGALHVDSRNVGPSMMLTVGTDIQGGQLYVHKQGTMNTKNNIIFFNGNNPHITLPYSGVRYSIVFFTHLSARTVYERYPSGIQLLRKVGYNIPHRTTYEMLYEQFIEEKKPKSERITQAIADMPTVVLNYHKYSTPSNSEKA